MVKIKTVPEDITAPIDTIKITATLHFTFFGRNVLIIQIL